MTRFGLDTFVARCARATAALAVLGCVLAQPVSSQVRICPLGDSITESSAGRHSYRYYLDQLLTSNGYSFDFVGHNFGVWGGAPANPNFDQDHESYSGWQVNHILMDLQWWTWENLPDIVLIHLGTNDEIAGQSRTGTINELKQCIDILRGVNPNVTVLLAQILPRNFGNHHLLNAMMPPIVTEKDTPESRVVLVDHYSAFGPPPANPNDPHPFLYDGLHPNDAGEQLMAQVWYDAIKKFMTPTANEWTAFGSGCAGSAPATPAMSPIAGQAASLAYPFTTKISDAPFGAAAFGIMGFDPVSFFGTPLPIDITILGAPGCAMYVGPDITFPLANIAGQVTWTIEIPNNPALVGGIFLQQGAFLHPSLNALGLTFSDAAQITVVE